MLTTFRLKTLYVFGIGSLGLLFSFHTQGQETEGEAETSEAQAVLQLEVEAPAEETPGQRIYTAEKIAATPTPEGDLSDLLKTNPAIEFAREADLSAGMASLRPEEISVHGQAFYQNLFLIDGTDTSNDLNPAAAQDTWSTPSLFAPHGGSSPQG